MNLVFLPSTRSDLLWMRTYYTSIFPAGANIEIRLPGEPDELWAQ